MSMVDYALQLAGRGFRILPVRPDKKSHIKAWQKDATTDPAQIERWWRTWPEAGIGILCGDWLVVVDLDGKRAAETLKKALGGRPMPATLRARTGRLEGGQHAYYRVPEGMKLKSSRGGGIEVQYAGRYVIAPPSLHKSGRRYEWVKDGDGLETPIMPIEPWLVEALGAREKEGRAKKATVSASGVPEHIRSLSLPRLAGRAAAGMEEVDPDDLMAAALALPNDETIEWDDWNDRLMAFWRASNGSPEGKAAANVWSAKCKAKHGIKETVESRWEHYPNSPPTELGFGSIVFWIRETQPGWMPPSREPKATPTKDLEPEAKKQDEFFKPEEGKVNGHKSLAQLFNEIDLDKPGNPLIKLNEKFAAIGDLGGKCLIMSWVESKVDRTVKVPSFQTFKSFSERYLHKYVTLKSTGDNGEVVEEVKSLGAYWLKWGHRRTFEGIDLVPNGEYELPGKVLNLWQGFAIEPKAGAWPLMRRHILDVLAAGDRACADYIARWAAWAVQNPDERAEAALVLKGGKGSGKGTFADAMRQIFGQHGLHIFNSKHLVGAFNGHLRNCLFLFADEAFWAGDKHGEAVLKGMLTEPVLMIEQKGIDATAWKNRLHVIMAANAEWVVPASHDERRYAVFEVSSARMGDEAYFAALRAEMVGGGLAAMLHDLLHLNLKDWHPRKIVRTAALAEQKARSLDPRHEWWESVLQSGVLPGTPDSAGAIPAHTVYARARDDVPKLKDASVTNLGRFLRSLGGEGLHRKMGNYWSFPALIECRRIWTDKFGQWPWRNDLTDWHA